MTPISQKALDLEPLNHILHYQVPNFDHDWQYYSRKNDDSIKPVFEVKLAHNSQFSSVVYNCVFQ